LLKTIGLIAAAAAFAISPSALRADDGLWPCEILLCLSNPGGAGEFAQCLPPIRKLPAHLASLKPFPVCREAGVSAARYTPPAKSGQSGRVEMRFADGRVQAFVLDPNDARLPSRNVRHPERDFAISMQAPR